MRDEENKPLISSDDDEAQLIPVQLPSPTECDFVSDPPKKLADFVKALSSKGWRNAVRVFYLTGTTTLSVMVINTRTYDKLVLSMQYLNNCTNFTVFLNDSIITPGSNMTCGELNPLTLGEILGPGFWPLVVFMDANSGWLTFFSRLPSVTLHREGLSVALSRINPDYKISPDEDNFFRIAHTELDRIREVFSLSTDQIYVKIPKSLKKSTHFPFVEKVLKGIHGNKITFVSNMKLIRREPASTACRIIHIAPIEERNLHFNFEATVIRFNFKRGCTVFEKPFSCGYALEIFLKVNRFFFVRILSDLLMGLTVFNSMMTVFDVNRPNISIVARAFILAATSAVVIGRVIVNDAFKVTAAYAFIDELILRVRYWRWPAFKESFFPVLGGIIISSICFLYGYGLGDSFGTEGFVRLAEQISWLIPQSKALFDNPGFLSVMTTLAPYYSNTQSVMSGIFYFISGYSSVVKKLKEFQAWCVRLAKGEKKMSSPEDKLTSQEKALMGGIAAAGVVDAVAYALTTYLFAITAGSTERATNIFWYLARAMGNQFQYFAIATGIGNATQNLLFSLNNSYNSIKVYRLILGESRITNYQLSTFSGASGNETDWRAASSDAAELEKEDRLEDNSNWDDMIPSPDRSSCFGRCVIL